MRTITSVISGLLLVASLTLVASGQTASFDGHDYTVINTTGFADARAQAAAMGGYVVSINDKAENDFLVATFAPVLSLNPFIGLTDEVVEGTFVWESGELTLFTLFAQGEPNGSNGNEDHVVLRADGAWDDMSEVKMRGRKSLRNLAEALSSSAPPTPKKQVRT